MQGELHWPAPGGNTVVGRLEHWNSTQPDNVVHRWLDGTGKEKTVWTYGALRRRACVVANLLRNKLGCQPGDRAALMYLPGLDFIAAFWGCLYAGVIAVPVYPVDLERSRFPTSVSRFGRLATRPHSDPAFPTLFMAPWCALDGTLSMALSLLMAHLAIDMNMLAIMVLAIHGPTTDPIVTIVVPKHLLHHGTISRHPVPSPLVLDPPWCSRMPINLARRMSF